MNGRTLTFGVSGLLRQSNLVMWDHETESWWQQGTAEAIVGSLAGTRLEPIAAQVVTWREFKAAFPQGTTISAAEGPHGYNPYAYYDTNPSPFLFSGALLPPLPATERVVGVLLQGKPRAYPFRELAKQRLIQESLGDARLVIFYEPSALSALDAPDVGSARSVGSASVFVPQAGGQKLTFAYSGKEGLFVDQETGSQWNMLGQAVQGPLKGQRLPPLLHTQGFWFYWAAIYPATTVYGNPG
ncbi:MAG: DUF3179 domain-containing protein [Chloroflexi bacterium]|nr:DUF3179 domain-containing protein [Chloroflexota bacterium]